MDKLSDLSLRLLDLLLLKQPFRTVLGVMLGIFALFVFILFKPFFDTLWFINTDDVPYWIWPLVGVVIANSANIIKQIVRPEDLSEEVRDAINVIEQAKKSGAPKIITDRMWMDLCQKVVDRVVLKEKIIKEIQSMKSKD